MLDPKNVLTMHLCRHQCSLTIANNFTKILKKNVMWIWNDFLLPQLVINKPQWHTIPLRMFYFFGQYSKKWNLALAGLVISMIPIVVFYLGAQQYIIKGVTEGSIKS